MLYLYLVGVILTSVLWADNWVSFSPARRALDRLSKLIRYFGKAGAGA
jgi:hypothetical protein